MVIFLKYIQTYECSGGFTPPKKYRILVRTTRRCKGNETWQKECSAQYSKRKKKRFLFYLIKKNNVTFINVPHAQNQLLFNVYQNAFNLDMGVMQIHCSGAGDVGR